MEKDLELKRDPRYQTANLRERISKNVKQIRDCGEEIKEAQGKALSKRVPKDTKRNKNDW